MTEGIARHQSVESAERDRGKSTLAERFLRVFSSTLRDHPTAAFALMGFVTYAFLRTLHVNFYRRLGVSPDEVGLGYVETLSDGFAGMLFVMLFIALLVGLTIFGLFLGESAWELMAERSRPSGTGDEQSLLTRVARNLRGFRREWVAVGILPVSFAIAN